MSTFEILFVSVVIGAVGIGVIMLPDVFNEIGRRRRRRSSNYPPE
jgi:hypothetical protein